MKKLWRKLTHALMAISLGSFFTLAAAETIIAAPDPQSSLCAEGFTLVEDKCEVTFNFDGGAQEFIVPNNLGPMKIEVVGAAGGQGGLDCGAGCTAALSGPAGRLILNYSDLSGKRLKLYPGGKGGNGASGARSSGAGAGGVSTFSADFNGGRGGNTGSVGSSGAGGGGGAASIMVIEGETFIAAGAGGGGGSANSINGSTSGNNEAKISVGYLAVNIYENQQVSFQAPKDSVFVGSRLRYESSSNSNCGANISPDVSGKKQITLQAFNSIWGDPCNGVQKRIVGTLSYALGSLGGNGEDSSCSYYCDGAGGGGGGGGVNGGAGGGLYQAPSGSGEAAGFGGSAGTNSRALGPVRVSDFVATSSAGFISLSYTPIFAPSAVSFERTETTNSRTHKLRVTLPGSGTLTAAEVKLSGSAESQSMFRVLGAGKTSGQGSTVYTFNVSQLGNKAVAGELVASVRGVDSASLTIDQVGPSASIKIQPETLRSATHVYEVRFDKPVSKPDAADFAALGLASNCSIGYVTGSDRLYQVSLEGCSDGTFGLALKANSVTDLVGNYGPAIQIASELFDKSSPQVVLDLKQGVIPKEFLRNPAQAVLGELDKDTQLALSDIGIYSPMDGAPTANVVADLSQSLLTDSLNYQSTQEITVGSTVTLGIQVSPEVAKLSDAVAFVKTGNLWQYLGRKSFTGTILKAESFGVAKSGSYQIKLVVIGRDVITNMSLPRSFGQSVPLGVSQAVTEAETNLAGLQVDITLNSVAGAEGDPKVVDQPTASTPPIADPGASLLEIKLPEINLGEPVANPAIGATGDDTGPSLPFDPLGTPESVAHVVKTTASTVAVVSAVAAAAAAAVGAASPSAGSSSSSSSSSNQNTDQQQGEITNIDANVESFTSVHTGWGDRIPIFRFGIFTFLDKFTHNLTEQLAKFSPVLSKIVNDGAYLRASLGSLWLVFPASGIYLASSALAEPAGELSTPAWQLFLAIAVLGMFDAFSGMLATLIYAIGVIHTFGVDSPSDVRLLMGVLLLGFGPSLIAIAFRQIRRHFETGFSYIWDRLADVAVLGFFTYWTVGSMVSTLPALAGKTLSAANHVNDFAICLAFAVVLRIVLEELAARGFANRLDKINPTEVPESSQLQKVLSTALRLSVFIFVTAAFMGNVWQVWVGSIIFILPNILSWFEDKLPNSPVLWKLIPTGLPGLAFSLVVASYSSVLIGQWIGDWPDFAQWSFMLLPIPAFIIGLIAMFGREGKDGEERPILKPRWRYVYRIGGIMMLFVTASLAGVI